MELILKEDVLNLGKQGQVVKVKEGYARNYLIPKGLALELTPANLKVIESQRRKSEQKLQDEKKKAEEIAQRLSNLSCTITMPAGDDDRLFGAVTHSDVADALAQENIIVDKKDIVFDEEIRKLGIYYFKVKLHPDITPSVKLWVVKK